MSRLPLRPGLRVLDAACGTGNLAVHAARAGCRTSGLDIASNLVAQARIRAEREELAIDYTEGDAEDLPYPDASFDAVISNGVFNLVADKVKALQEVFRVLKPGGRFMLADQVLAGELPKEIKARIENWAR